MSTSDTDPARSGRGGRRSGRWIDEWRPEDAEFWNGTGRRIARRNLLWSVVAEHFGFSVWVMWSILVIKMGANSHGGPGPAGFSLTTDQQLWLVAVPSGVGAFLRLPYTFAVPAFGGRNWTIFSALLLIVPCGLMMWAVQHPELSMGWLLLIAAVAGVGGGNFASSMTNISFFYPEKEKGWALGLNAAGGNLGVAVIQKLGATVIAAGTGTALARIGLIYIPLAIIAAVGALLFMDNLRDARADVASTASAARRGQTWIMSFLYIGTFGSFIGYSTAFPALLKNPALFDRADVALSYGFLGALVGSVARPLGGRLGDRLGGARVTVAAFAAMTLGGLGAVASIGPKGKILDHPNFGLFFASFMLLFLASGIGNGSTYRMIPAIFARRGRENGGDAGAMRRAREEAAGAIGICSAVGAFGGFLVPIIYAQSNKAYGTIAPALWVYIGLFVVMAAVTWWSYLRRGGIEAAPARAGDAPAAVPAQLRAPVVSGEQAPAGTTASAASTS
ncbi:Nitrate transporter [Frankia canadensis]|uniref:Nitrate transporter n=1 Tax=Frankia canadensis TaxID=1836972 RepID=A0A2I2KNX7_9ACTN|nr:nitrate/nitrite transporter [Frankia canadensis]SNQ47375.1 Nitrate transporter [Frankia canadensis]SOU54665.1 Nitrate transporter [Frankia canadensis]